MAYGVLGKEGVKNEWWLSFTTQYCTVCPLLGTDQGCCCHSDSGSLTGFEMRWETSSLFDVSQFSNVL